MKSRYNRRPSGSSYASGLPVSVRAYLRGRRRAALAARELAYSHSCISLPDSRPAVPVDLDPSALEALRLFVGNLVSRFVRYVLSLVKR